MDGVVASVGLFWFIGVSAFVYFDLIASSLFPHVPEQFGGGQPRTVELVFADEAMRWAVGVALLGDESDTRSNEMQLLWETESSLILRDPSASDDAVFQIERSMVSAVIVDPPDIYPSSIYRSSDPTPVATPAS